MIPIANLVRTRHNLAGVVLGLVQTYYTEEQPTFFPLLAHPPPYRHLFWNAQQSAFRIAMLIGVVLLCLLLRDPE